MGKPRRSATVRLTHWISAIGILALIVSGTAILFAHPRLYWGETGAVGTPALIDLPIPFMLGHSGWGRYLHFLAAWLCLASGLIYLVHALASGHLRRDLVPARAELKLDEVRRAVSGHLPGNDADRPSLHSYNVVQRVSYLTVVFVLGPLALLTGLAFSPALASVAPVIVNMFGGQQSARTIHFFVAAAIVLFVLVHLVLVCTSGFRARMRGMI
ncbi:MAG TPA: cytochrome b/b6 domain-containing protein [Steroidobacteraceae bacterium]|jgi:thiosulfate reductase cytochrome b subunit